MSLYIEQGKLYQPIENLPEYASVNALQPCIERWRMIEPWLQRNPGIALDLGCHTGWFCRRFAELGWQSVGYEKSEEYIETARAIPCHGSPVPVYKLGDILDAELIEADVVLCLSTAMYLFDDLLLGWAFFERVSELAPQMFIDFGGSYAGYRLPFNEKTAIIAILDHTYYNSGQLLGHTDFESRPLFRFSR